MTRTIDSIRLLTFNRLDIAFKLAYLELKNKNPEFAKKIYKDHVKIITSGLFKENDSTKKGFDNYVLEFDSIYNSIKQKNFNREISTIPVCKNHTILNGSHRVSSSIFLNNEVEITVEDKKAHHYDYSFFKTRGIDPIILNYSVKTFLKYSNNSYLAIIWPSANKSFDYLKFFDKIIFEKKITFSSVGALNFIIKVYESFSWLGKEENNFSGAYNKMSKCFKNSLQAHAIFFQSDSFENVLKIKDELRFKFGIGKSSIHITDNSFETLEISKYILNENSLNYLNNSSPFHNKHLINSLEDLEKKLAKKNIDTNEVLLMSNSTLVSYDIKKNSELDFIHSNQLNNKIEKNIDKEINKEIFNPTNYYYFKGFKFITLEGILNSNLVDIKDEYLKTIKNKIKASSSQKSPFEFLLKQKYLLIGNLIPITKRLGIYDLAKLIFKKLKSKNIL